MRSSFKNEEGKVAELLSKAEPEEVTDSMQKNGYYSVGGYRILPEQVDITREKTVLRGTRFVPHVVEPSFGSDRLFYIALEYAYHEKDDRIVMSFPRSIAPMQLGVYPLVSKDGLAAKAAHPHQLLTQEGFTAEFEETGSIGRRYA